MTPEEIAEVGQDIASALYARGREERRRAIEAGLGGEFAEQIATVFFLAARVALLRSLRLATLSSSGGGAVSFPPSTLPEQVH